MTEILVEPYRKLVIRTYMRYRSYEEMARQIAAGAYGVPMPTVVLRWSKGILFNFVSYQPTDSVMRQLMDGILYWDHLDFAEMPEYKEEIPLAGSPARVLVRNLTGHPLFDQVAEFVRANLL